MRNCIDFLFFGFVSFIPLFARGTLKTKEHITQTINSLNVLFLFVMVILVSSHAMKSASHFKIFHSPTPFYVNLINVLQKSCLTGLFHDYQTCLTWSIEVQTICFAISICYTYHSFRAHYNVCMYRIYVYLELA